MTDPRRAIPATDALLTDPELDEATRRLGRTTVTHAIHQAQAASRDGSILPTEVRDEAVRLLPRHPTRLRRVINASGVVIHTNLGRAPLSAAAREAVQVAAGATDVELDLSTGRRGRRGRSALAALASAVPSAEDVHVVNNGAAALALAASALADGRPVVVSRGELVEIGDGFRIPELLEAAGAPLREVGTTNRVRFEDYAEAVDDETGFVLKVHPSNFVVSGFTSSVSTRELTTLGAPVVADIGSGLLHPHPRLPAEPDASTILGQGAALVTASGDKLLGGPQCGLLLGRADIVQRLRRHPLARAYRVDKLTLAALEATLGGPATPVEEALAADHATLRTRAERLRAGLADAVETVDAEVVDTVGAVGGGGAPEVELASAAVSLPAGFADPLRLLDPAVVGRVHHDRLLVDLLAVDPADDDELLDLVRRTAEQLAVGD
jgi:L-seryl-tRNA(Ser) seleniumtransferase